MWSHHVSDKPGQVRKETATAPASPSPTAIDAATHRRTTRGDPLAKPPVVEGPVALGAQARHVVELVQQDHGSDQMEPRRR